MLLWKDPGRRWAPISKGWQDYFENWGKPFIPLKGSDLLRICQKGWIGKNGKTSNTWHSMSIHVATKAVEHIPPSYITFLNQKVMLYHYPCGVQFHLSQHLLKEFIMGFDKFKVSRKTGKLD